MNVVEKANEVSVFGRWAANVSQVTSPWEYSIRRNVPAFTTTMTEDATRTWSAGSSLSWTFPRLGLLRDMRFKIDIDLREALGTAGNNATLDNPFTNLVANGTGAPVMAVDVTAENGGAKWRSIHLHPGGVMKLFTQYEIRARTREVARMYPENIYYHYMSQVYSYDKNFTHPDSGVAGGQIGLSDESSRITGCNILNGLHLQRLWSLIPSATPVFAAGVATGKSKILTVYLHVPFSYFQRMGNAFLTSFCEDLSINLQCASSAAQEALGPLGSYLTSQKISVTPQYSWIQPRPEEMAKLRQQMLASSLGIPRLQFSCLSEGDGVSPPAAPSGAVQAFTMKLSCSYPVIRTLFWIQTDVGLSDLQIPHASNTVTVPITRVQVSGSGTTFLDMSESQVLEQMILPPHNKVMGDRIIYAINWSLLDTNTEMGGYLPTRNLSNLTFTVNAVTPLKFTDKGSATASVASDDRTLSNYKLRVIHEYYVIEQTVPSNGQVNVSAFD